MANVWFCSDHHFGDDRFDILFRPYDSVENFNNDILEKHNSLVKEDDTVFFLGDVLTDKKFFDVVSNMNGKKHLIKGNHEGKIPDDEYRKYFESVSEDVMLNIKPQKNKKMQMFLNHYPTKGKKDCWNICGHVHGLWKVQKNMVNVGIDAHAYSPVSLSKIIFLMNAINKYYDDDVWCYNHPANKAHDYRGKKGSYYDETE